MHVQSVPGLARIGLGHEGGVHLVVVGDVLDQALEQHRVVAGLEGVVDVVEVDLELRRCGFGDDGVGRDALGAGAVDDVLEALDVFVEVVDGVHLHRLRTFAGDRRARRLRPAVHVLLVDQVELQLEGGDDGQFHLGEPGHHLAQDFAGVGEERLAFQFVHGHQQLRGRALLPGFHGEGAGDRVADPVGVADVETQAGTLYGGAGDIEGEQGSGEIDTFFEDFVQTVAFDPLAANHAIHVCNKEVDELDLGMFLEELARFSELNGTLGYRHDATPFLLKISIMRGVGYESIRKPVGCQ